MIYIYTYLCLNRAETVHFVRKFVHFLHIKGVNTHTEALNEQISSYSVQNKHMGAYLGKGTYWQSFHKLDSRETSL